MRTAQATPSGGAPEGVKNARSMLAMSVFLIDYQNKQILNGEDEGTATATNGPEVVVSPVSPGFTITNSMGPRKAPCQGCSTWHQGTDFTSSDRAVFAIADGTVARKFVDSAGNTRLEIRHADGLISSYWHMPMSSIPVEVGDSVTAGQRVGTMGKVGQATGIHLHIELDISKVDDRSKYKQYTINSGGYNPNQRVDIVDFLAKNGVEGF